MRWYSFTAWGRRSNVSNTIWSYLCDKPTAGLGGRKGMRALSARRGTDGWNTSTLERLWACPQSYTHPASNAAAVMTATAWSPKPLPRCAGRTNRRFISHTPGDKRRNATHATASAPAPVDGRPVTHGRVAKESMCAWSDDRSQGVHLNVCDTVGVCQYVWEAQEGVERRCWRSRNAPVCIVKNSLPPFSGA